MTGVIDGMNMTTGVLGSMARCLVLGLNRGIWSGWF